MPLSDPAQADRAMIQSIIGAQQPAHAGYTPATRQLHASYTPVTRRLHAGYTLEIIIG